jgi:hypothetical protein
MLEQSRRERETIGGDKVNNCWSEYIWHMRCYDFSFSDTRIAITQEKFVVLYCIQDDIAELSWL